MALLFVLGMAGCTAGNSSASGSNVTATPTFSPGAGSFNTSQTVTIADATSGAVLYCTTDGTTPTTSSPRCSQPTTIFKTQFLQAIAVAPGMTASPVASAGYTVNLNAAATPTFSPAGGSYAAAQTVSISDTTAGANIYYTTDGTIPTANSLLYVGSVVLSKSSTLSAVAMASGLSNSGVASASYTIGQGTATPVISPAGGSFNAVQTVNITDATPGAAIYYTTDGSVPTASSASYGGPITVSSSQTLQAIAVASNIPSSVATAAFTISLSATAPPTFSPVAGTYGTSQSVLLSDTTPGATIYYTLDGSTPTTSSAVYGNPITVSSSQTIKAIASASGLGSSAVASAAYTINLGIDTPTFSPLGGTFSAAQTVTISDTTPGAAIYYTEDGSVPLPPSQQSSSQLYVNPISVSATKTLNAIAVSGSASSAVGTASYTINTGAPLRGSVFSGELPVNGSQIQVYAAGQTGYGSDATPLLATPATTDGSGSFSVHFDCPSSPGDLVYLVATGGSTGSSGSNSGLRFMAAFGPCGNLSATTTYVVNEVTTVASAYALSPFMTGATKVGSSPANYQGLSNAFKTVTNLTDLATGKALTITPAYAANPVSFLNSSTVPQRRIHTLANALNACAAKGGCSSLFSAATPNGGAAPADTLQAILNIAQNPGMSPSEIFNVASTSGDFQPALEAAPNDWTLALTFTGGGLGFAPDFPVPFTNGIASTGRLESTALAIDATGNLLVTGFNNGGDFTGSAPDVDSGMIAAFDTLGAPLTPASTKDASGAVTFGGYIAIHLADGIGTGGTMGAHAIAIDPSGNVWVNGGQTVLGGQPGSALSEVKHDGSGFSLVLPYVQVGTNGSLLTPDSSGNVWLFDIALEQFGPKGEPQITNPGKDIPPTTFPYDTMQTLTFDSNGGLWGSSTTYGDLYQINSLDGNGIYDYFPNLDGQYTNLVAGNDGNIYGCGDTGGQTLDVLNATSTSILNRFAIPTQRGCGNQMVMDGAGHLFTVTGGSVPGILDEFTVSGSAFTPVSPVTTGYTGTGTGEAATINPDPDAPLVVSFAASAYKPTAGVMGAVIDGSGNLWVLNVDTGTTASPGNVLVEFVGIAAPVVTPNSLALQNGQVGVRP